MPWAVRASRVFEEIIGVSFLGKEICFDKKLCGGLKMGGSLKSFIF